LAGRVALAAVVVIVIGAAACVRRADASQLSLDGSRVLYVADPGEANAVRISGGVRDYVVRDAGAELRVVAPCRRTRTGAASCPAQGVSAIEVRLEDGNDTATVETGTVPTALLGGPGDDRLLGGTGSDTIDGGDGADVLVGRSGHDALEGGPGRDSLRGGPGNDVVGGGADDDMLGVDGGADSLDGGPGFDTVSYGGRSFQVNVSLDAMANDGQSNEADNVQPTVERIRGGQGADVLSAGIAGAPTQGVTLQGGPGDDLLTGGAGPDDLRGGPGNDVVAGGAGPDLLAGGVGFDTIRGDDGDDLIGAADGMRDQIDCGAGIDSASLDGSDGGSSGCERHVPGGTPGGTGQSDIAGAWQFSARLRRERNGTYDLMFSTRIIGDRQHRKTHADLRVRFIGARGRAVGSRRLTGTKVDTRLPTTVNLPSVPKGTRKVRIIVDE
jgi:Ca2+-binding RTX toxin-like protein